MNYHNKNIAITGGTGFLGNNIGFALEEAGANVKYLSGDIRDRLTFEPLDYSYDYLFHFAAPSSQVLFKRKGPYCIEATIAGFMNASQACEKHGVRLIYPSTGLLSSGRFNEYAMCKKLCEDYASNLGVDSLGLRIFATYGPGEAHKADYASVPYLFIRDVLDGRQPVIFGNGEQVRDFIYIDDVVSAALVLAEECSHPIIDLGSGESTAFGQIIIEMQEILKKIINPIYIDKPTGYVTETMADISRLTEFYVPEVDFKAGIERTIRHEESRRNDNNKPTN